MMDIRSRRAVGLLACAFALGLAAPAMAADEKKAAKAVQPKVLLENDKVRVTEVHYKPGESSEMRERAPRVTRALTAGTMERTYADGKKETVNWKAGDVKWSPKEAFVNKNVGKSDIVLYVVTPK
jgi:hypothetical protein